ncbi:MAG: PIN domain-containing protein [Actinobacteria bacterium]|nr:PIN domain-containing protein [Actinomycetota bacterium]
MIVYFETSALVKLILEEEHSDTAASIWDAADARLSSRITYPEARAGLASAFRMGRLTDDGYAEAKSWLRDLLAQITTVELTRETGLVAGELAERCSLRGYDAVHLSSALIPERDDLVMATWDGDLLRAAGEVGLPVATVA